MRRGWCPGLYDPMPTGDGLLVRVKPPGGRLLSGAARLLAREALRCGNGTVELTSRGNLQVRGLTAGSVQHFAAAMVAAGLASADPGVERRRNVMLLPGGCGPAATDAASLAASVEAMLAADPALAALPPKFGFAVDGGVLRLSEPADITVRTDGACHWIELSGAQARCPPGATVAILHNLAGAAGIRRMREMGAAEAFASVGLAQEPMTPQPAATPPVGFIADPSTVHGAFGMGLPFGQTDATTLGAIADAADRFGDGTLRLSPWRVVLLGHVSAALVPALRDAVVAAGLIAEVKDRRLHMAACIGSAGCASGTVRARDDAAVLASAGWTGFLHVSGCAKGCAHPGDACNTLVGEGGSYSLVRDGRASGVSRVSGLSVPQAAAYLGQHS